MIFLVGTHHERQHNGIGSTRTEDNKDFVKFLKEQATQKNVALIAEELNEEALKKSEASESTLKCIAQDLGISHSFCDPNTEERKNIGIPSCEELRLALNLPRILDHESLKKLDEEKKKYFGIREKFWLKKIGNQSAINIIFVCGIQHLESFQRLISQNSLESVILEKKF